MKRLVALYPTAWRVRYEDEFIGIASFTFGGGPIILAALGSIAVAPGWYARRDDGPLAPTVDATRQ